MNELMGVMGSWLVGGIRAIFECGAEVEFLWSAIGWGMMALFWTAPEGRASFDYLDPLGNSAAKAFVYRVVDAMLNTDSFCICMLLVSCYKNKTTILVIWVLNLLHQQVSSSSLRKIARPTLARAKLCLNEFPVILFLSSFVRAIPNPKWFIRLYLRKIDEIWLLDVVRAYTTLRELLVLLW